MIGSRINNYEVLSVLGEGGMGTVYLAQHPVMGRKAAIKLLRRELAEDKTLVARFINEARAANAIRHPNIIDVIDVGTLPDGLPYMMMEFLDGQSLAQRLRDAGQLSVVEALSIAKQTAAALAAAHDKGIVHRDLKPDNLFLVSDVASGGPQRVKVLDFGIAKLRGELGGGSVKTNAGSILGTPPYMSPEQCRGINDEIDQRTDIYALGIILFEMLCGKPPFMSDGYGDLIIMHLQRAPQPPRELNAAIPEPVEQAILRALAKEAKYRFASMRELSAALVMPSTTPVPGNTMVLPATPIQTTLSSVTGQMVAAEPATAEHRRRPWLLAAAAVASALVAIVGVAALWPRTVVKAPAAGTGPPGEPAAVAVPEEPPSPPRPSPPEPAPPAPDGIGSTSPESPVAPSGTAAQAAAPEPPPRKVVTKKTARRPTIVGAGTRPAATATPDATPAMPRDPPSSGPAGASPASAPVPTRNKRAAEKW